MRAQHHPSKEDQAQISIEALRAEFDKQRSIIKGFYESSPYMMGIAELEGDTIIGIHGNAVVAKHLGLSLDDIQNRTGEELGSPPEENRIWLAHYRRSQKERKPVRFEYERPDHEGQWLSVTVNYLGPGSQDRSRFSYIAEDISGRKHIEQDLANSERRFREIVKYAPTAIYEIDFRTGKFTSVNDWMVELSGYSREELLEMSAFGLLDEEGKELFKERIRRWLAGEKPDESVEYRVKAKDGHTIYAVLYSNFIKDADGSFIGATVIGHDITERKLAELSLRASEAHLRESEAHLRASEERIRKALSIDTVGVLFFNLEGVITSGNAAFQRMFGYSPEDFEKGLVRWDIMTPPEFMPASLHALEELRTKNETTPYEKQYIRKDGSRWWGLFAAKRLDENECVEFVLDITEGKQVEEALRQSEERLATVFEVLPVGVGLTDTNGRLLLANQEMRRFLPTGMMPSLDDVRYGRWHGYHPDGRRIERTDYSGARALRGERVLPGVEYLYTNDDGSEIWTSVAALPVKDGEGRISGVVSVVTDIDESKRAAITLRKSEERFRSSIENLSEAFTIFSSIRNGDKAAQGGKIVDFLYEYVNDATCLMTNRTRGELINHRFLHLWPNHQESGLFDKYVQVVETGQPLNEQAFYYDYGTAGEQLVSGAFDIRASKFGDGLIVTINDVTEQARLEAENQKAIQEREIHHRLSEQREKERQSFARDIHDGPIQTLSSLAFSLQFLKEAYPDPKLQLELSQIALSVKGAVQELRQVMNELRPPNVLRFGLAKAIQLHAENLRERYPQITWNLKLANDEQVLQEQTCLALFRIYQEAINNIIRHSEAAKAWVYYRVLKDRVILEIRDNGKGFAGNQDIVTLTSNQHFGLAGISERVQAIQGALEIISSPGEGTTIRVSVPIKQE